nr:hypothetical protein [uncultured Lacibacter sp.]
MKAVTTLALVVLLFASCGKQYKYWDVSKFNMVDSALKDKEEIKLIYASQGPGTNSDKAYYYHVIAISQKTGDTVNILTLINNGFSTDDGDKVFNFLDQHSLAAKLVVQDPEKLANVDNVKQLDKEEITKATKVARDPAFDFLADNKYPTVIGFIGTISKIDDQDTSK